MYFIGEEKKCHRRLAWPCTDTYVVGVEPDPGEY